MIRTHFHLSAADVIEAGGAAGILMLKACQFAVGITPTAAVCLYVPMGKARALYEQIGKAIAEEDRITALRAEPPHICEACDTSPQA